MQRKHKKNFNPNFSSSIDFLRQKCPWRFVKCSPWLTFQKWTKKKTKMNLRLSQLEFKMQMTYTNRTTKKNNWASKSPILLKKNGLRSQFIQFDWWMLLRMCDEKEAFCVRARARAAQKSSKLFVWWVAIVQSIKICKSSWCSFNGQRNAIIVFITLFSWMIYHFVWFVFIEYFCAFFFCLSLSLFSVFVFR